MRVRFLALFTSAITSVASFAPIALLSLSHQPLRSTSSRRHALFSTVAQNSAVVAETTTTAIVLDPKEAVKVFGRLAEKYIMLDSSGGLCCYSACKDCEFRRPDGGYIMADQSAARPKWIPSYTSRAANGKEHVSKWSSQLFRPGQMALTKGEFCHQLVQLDYAPILGGPFVSASAAASIESNSTAAAALFDALADGKEKLTKIKMSTRLKQLASGDEGLVWSAFATAVGII
jgi:hypothetical protein